MVEAVRLRIGVVEDRLAILIPVGVNAGEDISWTETFQVHPALIGTFPMGESFEINAAGKLIFPINGDLLIWLNFGLGVGLSSDLERWAILPEVGYSFCLDASEVDPIIDYGVALVLFSGP